MGVFYRHGKPLFCTEDVVTAAANFDQGPDALEFILRQDGDAKISSSMVMLGPSWRSTDICYAQPRSYPCYEEEHSIPAASNRYDPYTIFTFLQMKGKLGDANPTSELLNTGPAKRRRVSPKLSPRISTNVIDAAFPHPEKGAALRLLESFAEWGSITATDCDNRIMAESDTRTDYDNGMPQINTHSNIPSISQSLPRISTSAQRCLESVNAKTPPFTAAYI